MFIEQILVVPTFQCCDSNVRQRGLPSHKASLGDRFNAVIGRLGETENGWPAIGPRETTILRKRKRNSDDGGSAADSAHSLTGELRHGLRSLIGSRGAKEPYEAIDFVALSSRAPPHPLPLESMRKLYPSAESHSTLTNFGVRSLFLVFLSL